MRPLSRVAAAALVVVALLSAFTTGAAPASASPQPVSQNVSENAVTRHVHDAVVALASQAQLARQQPRAATRHRAPAARRTRPATIPPKPVVKVVQVGTVRKVGKPAETLQARGARLLAALHYDWAALGYRIEFLPARNGVLGLTSPDKQLIQVFVKSSESDLVLSHTIAHELGHARDFSGNSPQMRADYLRIRGLPSQPWAGCPSCTDYATPAGDWAEVFAYWLAGPGDFRSQLAPAPTAAQLEQLEASFAA